MNVTKLVAACFDLNEGSRNIIIHNLRSACTVMLCVAVCWSKLRCMLLWALLRSETTALCQFTAPPLLLPPSWPHGGVFGGQAICPLLIYCGIHHLKRLGWPGRPGSHQRAAQPDGRAASKQACQPAENTLSQVSELREVAEYIWIRWVSESFFAMKREQKGKQRVRLRG